VNHCLDCQYCLLSNGASSYGNVVWLTCGFTYLDVLTGLKSTDIPYSRPSCLEARSNQSLCGRAGGYFQQSERKENARVIFQNLLKDNPGTYFKEYLWI